MVEVVNKVVALSSLTPHPRNYKNHPDEQVSQLGMSHARFGQFRSVVIWQRPNDQYVIVAGHGIIEAMKRNNVTEVRADVLPQDTPQAEIDAILVADNLHAQNSTDDEQMLATLLQEQADMGYDLPSLGSDDETLRQMLAGLGDELLEDERHRTTELNEPRGGSVESAYNILIECKDEPEQQRAYELAEREGFTCRVLTL